MIIYSPIILEIIYIIEKKIIIMNEYLILKRNNWGLAIFSS